MGLILIILIGGGSVAWASISLLAGPASPHALAVGTTPLPMQAGTMASASVQADQNAATVTVPGPKVWKEIPLQTCTAGLSKNQPCTFVAATAWTSRAQSLTHINAAWLNGATYYFEAVLSTAGAPGNNAQVRLTPASGTPIAGSTITLTSSTTPTLVRVGPFTLSGDTNYVFEHNSNAAGAVVYQVKVIVAQDYPSATATTVVLSGSASRAGSTPAEADRGRRFVYDSSDYDGTLDVRFEGVALVSGGVFPQGFVELYEVGVGVVTTLPAFGTARTLATSGNIAGSLNDGGEYMVRIYATATIGTATISFDDARLRIQQSGGFTQTMRYVDLTHTIQALGTTYAFAGGSTNRYHMDTEWGEDFLADFVVTLQKIGGSTGYARLFDDTANAPVTGSELTVTSSTPVWSQASSVELNPANGTYRVELKQDGGTAVELRGAWISVAQTKGKLHDYVLEISTTTACPTWNFRAVHESGSNLSRLEVANLSLRAGSSWEEQVAISSGTVTKSQGNALAVTGGDTLEFVVYGRPSDASSTSSIQTRLEGTCTGVHTVQRLSIQWE